jgi:hypothetical protein
MMTEYLMKMTNYLKMLPNNFNMKQYLILVFSLITIFSNAQMKKHNKKFYKLIYTDSIFGNYYYFEFRRNFKYYKFIKQKNEVDNDTICYEKLELGNRYSLNIEYTYYLEYNQLVKDSIHRIYTFLSDGITISNNHCISIGGDDNPTLCTSSDIQNKSIACTVEKKKGILLLSIRPCIRCAINKLRYRKFP